MKKFLYSIISILLIETLVLPGLSAFAAEAKSGYGIQLSSDDKYLLSTVYDMPATFEATIELPKNYDKRAGVIIGSYEESKKACLNLEVNDKGNPRLYVTDGNGTTFDVVFKDADVRLGKPVHIAISCDKAKGTVTLYVDGVLKQTIKKTLPVGEKVGPALRLGGDYRKNNTQNFKGIIHSVALWADVRTLVEIKSDMVSIEKTADNLISAWDMRELKLGEFPEKILDIGPKSRNFTYREESGWTRTGGYTGSYSYSIAVIGDTQKVTKYHPDKLEILYNWIADNAQEKNIKFAIGLGDITDRNTAEEWQTAKSAISKLNGIVPYSLVRGNHDGKNEFKNTFPIYGSANKISGNMGGNMLNTYQTFEVNNIKYLILNLDFAYTDTQMAWANEVVASHPEHNVIVTTHIYLGDKGSAQGISSVKYGSDFEAIEIWDKLLKKHKNIVMILSGHVPTDKIVMSTLKGDHGNLVKQLLIDPQDLDLNEGPTGLVAMFYFSETGKKVSVDYYSTIKGKYRDGANLSFTLNVIAPPEPETTPAPETTAAPEDTTAPAPTEGGCSSVIGGTLVVASVILGAAWVAKKRD